MEGGGGRRKEHSGEEELGWSEAARLIDREHQVCIKRTIFILIPNGKLQPIC